MIQTVFLIGFMGAGKTTLGKKLAAKLHLQFVDLDDAIAARYNVPAIKDLIEAKGFEYFRMAENETLKDVGRGNQVMSAGGGTPCYFDNMQWMKQNGIVVYLNMDEKTIFNRLKQTNMHERPLLKNIKSDADLQGFIHEKLSERLPFYQQAHISFNPLKQNVDELLGLLDGRAEGKG